MARVRDGKGVHLLENARHVERVVLGHLELLLQLNVGDRLLVVGLEIHLPPMGERPMGESQGGVRRGQHKARPCPRISSAPPMHLVRVHSPPTLRSCRATTQPSRQP